MPFYASFTGQKQGTFKGQSTASSGKPKAKVQFGPLICMCDAAHDVAAAAGLPTGNRQNAPFIVTRKIDSATPLLLRAFHAKTMFPKVVVQMLSAGSGGKEVVTKTIELTNAQILDAKHFIASASGTEKTDPGGQTSALYTLSYSSMSISDGRQSLSAASKGLMADPAAGNPRYP